MSNYSDDLHSCGPDCARSNRRSTQRRMHMSEEQFNQALRRFFSEYGVST